MSKKQLKKQSGKNLDKPSDFDLMPAYLDINGVIYEKLNTSTEPISFDIDDDVTRQLNEMMVKEGFVNHQELIRHILREKIKKEERLEALEELQKDAQENDMGY